MARSKPAFKATAFPAVLGFTARHWRQQPIRISLIALAVLGSTVADVLTPLYAGRLVDAVTHAAAQDEAAWNAALAAFFVLLGLGATAVLLRQAAFMGIISLTLKMIGQIVADAFWRLQRFSTDWHANSFAGSTVRKITRGMWALDLMNDTILVALLPSLVMLIGSTLLLGAYWPAMGAVIGIGSLIYVGVTVTLSVAWTAPAATLSNAWDTKLGGALADAISCNGVVKAFGAEAREEARLAGVMAKWRRRTRRTWTRGTISGGVQGGMMLALRAAILGAASCSGGRGSPRPATSPSC
jgi:ATP-binding cassette subfamily B protein